MATPIVLNNPESKSIAKKTTSALSGFAMGALGVSGVSPYSGGDKGAPMVPTPEGDWLTFADEGSGVKIQVMAWVHKSRNKNRPSEIRIAQRIKDSPDKGAPHMMVLQHRDGHFIKPTGYMIFEQWMRWTLTITTIRESYVDGQRVSHSETRESTSWNELQGRYKKLIEAPGIWEQFGLPPFGKLKGIIALFPLPDHFNPADWSLVKHETAKSTMFGTEVIKTVPFVLDLSQGKKNDLNVVQSPGGKTRYQRANGCPSAAEVMKAAFLMFVPVGLSGGTKEKTSAYKMKRIKQDAAHWARILILQPGPTGQWLKDYHRLSQPVQVDAAVAMATDIMLRIVTGRGLGLRDTQAWEKNFSRLNKHVRNLAIEAANRWKHGISEQQRSRISRNYSKLTPRLQQLFQREFVFTLASNLFFDLRQPDPVVLKPVNGARGGASIH